MKYVASLHQVRPKFCTRGKRSLPATQGSQRLLTCHCEDSSGDPGGSESHVAFPIILSGSSLFPQDFLLGQEWFLSQVLHLFGLCGGLKHIHNFSWHWCHQEVESNSSPLNVGHLQGLSSNGENMEWVTLGNFQVWIIKSMLLPSGPLDSHWRSLQLPCRRDPK